MTIVWLLVIFVPLLLLVSLGNSKRPKTHPRRKKHSGMAHSDSGPGFFGGFGSSNSSTNCGTSSSYDGGSCGDGGGGGGE
ncbi:hypothetical protein [Saccharibacillus kuerlensis]|uniref:Methanol dehydrogenase n=1 Tax=Saccharibacillus kuerlensis TaxID=459527 RepID=A0ABQ2L1Y1_9BACL|nr:hypothetical protein [Saccharibacillus kuerlensis]GGN99760.1 hypothetical protein GCM10010969_20180 [Saccharibacillus kuerlensis]